MADRDAATLTWRRLWAETSEQLRDRQHARWMCEVASGFDGAEFIEALDDAPTQRMVAHLDTMLARRLGGEPLQYVLGRWQFRALDLMVDRRVLIPRPETEWVAEIAIGIARSIAPPRRIVDLGTGSGALGLSMAAELPIASSEIWLTDVSPDAIDVARANLAGLGRAGAFVRVVQGSWFDALPAELRGTIDLVVSNPPYVADDDPELEADVAAWEPASALFGGHDGLDHVRAIVGDAGRWLRPGGAIVFEIGADQAVAVEALLNAHGFRHVEIADDLTGRPRVASARTPEA